MYADDLVVIAEAEDDLIKKLNQWKDFVENRGMRVDMNTRSPADAMGGRPYCPQSYKYNHAVRI